MLVGGTDTTRNQLGLAVLRFAGLPDTWDRLATDQAAVRLAVDEVLRYEPTASGTMRVATEQVTYRGIRFPRGAVLMLSSEAANRDPAVVAQCPHDFDAAAERTGWSSLSFGAGRHYCLGANLARAELQEALTVLPQRMPEIRILCRPEMKPVMGLYGPQRLDLAFFPSSRPGLR